MRAAVRTDVGRSRENNEDLAVIDGALGLMVVADGMGGHSGGEVASALAVHVILSSVKEALSACDGSPGSEQINLLLTQAIARASQSIRERAAEDPALSGMGTTVVVALARDQLLHIAHVGDSRAYLMRGHSLQQLTRDHSLIADMVSSGEVTPKEARTHRLRHFLSRSLGTMATPQVDVQVVPWQSGDYLLLCSDGLSSMLEDRNIETILARFRTDLDRACKELVTVANSRGGKDNISVILACPD